MPPEAAALRGPTNELDVTARYGSTESTLAVLSTPGFVDIDQGDPNRYSLPRS